MRFAPDTEYTLAFTVALGNTHPNASRSGTEELDSVRALMSLIDEYRFSGRRDRNSPELSDVRSARDRIRTAWTLDRDDMAGEINAMLRDANALPQLARHDGMDWHLHATNPEAPLAERIRVEVALALLDVVRSDETDRLRVCDADDCEGLLVDLSRNGSKRYCSVRCGNRMNMIAFRERAAG